MGSHVLRRLDVVETGRRRRWSPERKLQIVRESYAPGATASAVARLHGISAAHLFAWRKAFREGGLESDPGDFVPLVMRHEAAEARAADEVIEIVARNGWLRKLGEDVTSTLEAIPRSWKVVETVQEKVSCRDCEKVSQSQAPFHVIPRGWAGLSLLAMVLFEKFGQHPAWELMRVIHK